MSKKLIAVASATALALSALVGVAPASATPSIAYAGHDTDTTGTSADPYVLAASTVNTIAPGAGDTTVTATAQRITVTSIAAGDTVKVTTTGAVKVIDSVVTTANALIDISKVGSSEITKTLTSGTSQTLYVYTTSTTAGSYTIDVTKTASGTKSTTSATKYIKMGVGLAYNVKDVVVPSTLAPLAEAEVTFNVIDAFGNVRESNAGVTTVTLSTGETFAATWDSLRKLNYADITSSTSNPFTISIDQGGSDITGLPKHGSPKVYIVNSPAVASANTALTAQVAALTAQLAESRPKATSVTKKKYNTLARKWNAAFPSQKVALKK